MTDLLSKVFRVVHLKTSALTLLMLLGLTGCGSSSVWYSPTRTVTQTEEDLQACKYEANTRAHTPFPPSSMYADMAQIRRRADIKECMLGKGYQLRGTRYLKSQGLEFFNESPY
jgi:hypothetical protein